MIKGKTPEALKRKVLELADFYKDGGEPVCSKPESVHRYACTECGNAPSLDDSILCAVCKAAEDEAAKKPRVKRVPAPKAIKPTVHSYEDPQQGHLSPVNTTA